MTNINVIPSHILVEGYRACEFDFSVFEGYSEIYEHKLGLCDIFDDEKSRIKMECRLPIIILVAALFFYRRERFLLETQLLFLD